MMSAEAQVSRGSLSKSDTTDHGCGGVETSHIASRDLTSDNYISTENSSPLLSTSTGTPHKASFHNHQLIMSTSGALVVSELASTDALDIHTDQTC